MKFRGTLPESAGYLRKVLGTDPGAGVECSEAVPTNIRRLIMSFHVQLVTSSAVANRTVWLAINDGAASPSPFWLYAFNTVQTASQTIDYYLVLGLDAESTERAVSTSRFAGLPPLELSEGWKIITSTTNLQAGDDYGAPIMIVEEWIEV